MNALKRILSMSALVLLVTPMLVATIPVAAEQNEEPVGWWTETTVDRDGNGVGDMVERYMYHPLFLDDDGRISLIFDFDHTPTDEDITMLTYETDYEHQFSLPGINAVAGTIPVVEILDARGLPGIVMIELDGILEVANGDARVGHGVDVAFEETGYDGTGTTVAIIDTGLDGLHASIDDMDDDNSTDDRKILAFYDAVNNASNTNGTDFPYDDHGHGSHCGGTTAGTGAPDYEHVGMAPQAHLVGVKVLDGGGSGSFAGVMAGMQWTIDTMHSYNTRAASMSLGGPGAIEWTSSEEDSVNRMANEMVRSGIALFIAAGNSAVSAQIGTPGSAEDVITVGALDKDTGIAPYSSQGPTEEGRVKPNIAYMGSSIMSVAANTGDGYTAMSGTSMATPGAAGVGALMFQADPDLSPFDVRNIMQETATYRQCHYMAKNEPCAEDLIPKNRQNNVYGHGHTNAYESVMEAAQRSFTFNKNITLTLTNEVTMNGHIHLSPGESIRVEVTEGTDTVQWMSNDLRDGWSNIHSYEHGDVVYLTYEEIAHELEHLPGTELSGNHTLSMRGIKGTDASPLISFEIMLGEPSIVEEFESSGSNFILWGSLSAAILLTILLVVATMKNDRAQDIIIDDDIEEVVEAELQES